MKSKIISIMTAALFLVNPIIASANEIEMQNIDTSAIEYSEEALEQGNSLGGFDIHVLPESYEIIEEKPENPEKSTRSTYTYLFGVQVANISPGNLLTTYWENGKTIDRNSLPTGKIRANNSLDYSAKIGVCKYKAASGEFVDYGSSVISKGTSATFSVSYSGTAFAFIKNTERNSGISGYVYYYSVS